MVKQKRSNYSPSKLEKCLKEVKSKKLTCSAAAKLFGIPRSTLGSKLSGRRPEILSKPGPHAWLGKETEDIIEKWVLGCSRRGFPITNAGLLMTVTDIVKKLPIQQRKALPFSNDTPGRRWLEGFLARHPKISIRKPERLSTSRAEMSSEEIRNWFSETEKLLEEDGVCDVLRDPSRIFNVDECAIWMDPKGGFVLGKRGKAVNKMFGDDEKERITICFTICADGTYAPPMALFKGKKLPRTYSNSAPNSWGVRSTDSGWMTSEAFYEFVANVFFPYVVTQGIQRPVLLFMDGYRSHLSGPLSQFCADNGIVLVCLPPSATYIMQPLDVAYFKPLKMYWRKEVQELQRTRLRNVTKATLLSLLKVILDKYPEEFKKIAINGFRRCGLFPFNADNVNCSGCQFIELEEQNVQLEVAREKKTLLDIIESFIDPPILVQFRKTRVSNNLWNVERDYRALFTVWSKLIDSNEGFFGTMSDSGMHLDPPMNDSDILEYGCSLETAQTSDHTYADDLDDPDPVADSMVTEIVIFDHSDSGDPLPSTSNVTTSPASDPLSTANSFVSSSSSITCTPFSTNIVQVTQSVLAPITPQFPPNKTPHKNVNHAASPSEVSSS